MSDRIISFKDIADRRDDDSDSDDHPTYYAGGEKSGVMMRGPPKKKNNNGDNNGEGGDEARDLVQKILKKSAENGPGPEGADWDNAGSSSGAGPIYFQGAGYRLGSEDDQQEGASIPVVGGASSSSSGAEGPTRAQLDTPVVRHLTFWRNGFSVGEDGELLKYDDPANIQYVAAINAGFAPPELFDIHSEQAVEIKVARKLDEDYKEPPKKLKAFSGSGNRLGDMSTAANPIVGSGSSSASATGTVDSSQPAVVVDPSQPTTSIQVRLADGTRIIAKLNHSHTVADLYTFVGSSLPANETRRFNLLTVYPLKELSERDATIKDAGLVNAAVVQKWV